MTPLERQAENVARFLHRRRRFRSATWRAWSNEDARQEAAAVMLAFDDPYGPAAFKAAVRQVGRAVDRWSAPASIGDRGADARVRLTAESFSYRQLERGEGSPSAEDVVTAVRYAMFRAALHNAERAATRLLPKHVRQMGEAMQERGRWYGMHAEMAEQHGLSRFAVIRALGRWRRTADQSRDVQALKSKIREIEEEIRAC